MTETSRHTILVVAYACEPGRGSESEVGWRWALGIAELGHRTVVITRSNNRALIDAATVDIEPAERPVFIYHEGPGWSVSLKRLTHAHRAYYVVWQVSLARRIRQIALDERVDLGHHVTFVSARFLSAVAWTGVPYVWGPVGGLGRVPAELRSLLGVGGRIKEWFRDASMYLSRLDPGWRKTAFGARCIVAADTDTKNGLPEPLRGKAMVMPAIGVEMPSPERPPDADDRAEPELCTVGQLVPRKGHELTLRAVALVKDLPWHLVIVGEGPDRGRLEGLARELGVADRIEFTGRLPRDETLAAVQRCSAYIGLSLRESGGMALLEAASFGRPLVYLDHGGPRDVLGDLRAGQVSIGEPEQVIADAGRWVRVFLESPEESATAGRNAYECARKLDWRTMARRLEAIYE